MRHPARLFLAVSVALVGALALLEVALHLVPSLLPRSYLAGFPANGCEFFHPDVFARTPVEGVLLPHLAAAYLGPPPADLIELGLAPPEADADARRFPRVDLPADALGFPNPDEPQGWDLVLLGDSFGVSAGARHPEGLQAMLERETGLALHNLSLAGIGPVQERWLLETLALPKKPRAVLWLYFSGNDLTASYEPLLARRDGKATWAEAWPERRRPRCYVADLIAKGLRRSPTGQPASGRAPAPLPGFAFRGADGALTSLWFHPDNLRQCGWSRADWEAHPVWPPVQAELRAARDACARAGVRFLLVYLPTKPEVLLPHVAPEPELALRTTTALGAEPPAEAPDVFFATLLANRHAHEELLRDFCASESIPFLSAAPALEAQAARGELGYLTTDTHWQCLGHAALLGPLLGFLREHGVVP